MRTGSFVLAAFFMVAAGQALAEASAPADLEIILKGSAPGTTEESFLQAHPKAQRSKADEAAGAPDPARKAANYEELFETDPLLGLWCWASYGFKEGQLCEFNIIWNGEREKAAAQCERFFRAAVRRGGKDYRRDVMVLNPGAGNESKAPVLVWSKANCVILAVYSVGVDKDQKPLGAFTYACFPADDAFVKSRLIAGTLTPEELKAVYADIEPALTAAQKEDPAGAPAKS